MEWIVRIPGNSQTGVAARWTRVPARNREEALRKAQAAGYANAMVEGHTDPGQHSGFVGHGTVNWLKDNPSRVINLSSPAGNPPTNTQEDNTAQRDTDTKGGTGMWKLYRYTDANGKIQHTYILASQEPAIGKIIELAGGRNPSLVDSFDDVAEFLDDDRFRNAIDSKDLTNLGLAGEGGSIIEEDTFADLDNLGATLRNYLQGQGIDPGGGIARQAQTFLLPAAQAALGIGQALNPAEGDMRNLTNMLATGGLGGIAPEARNIFNQLAASGAGQVGLDTLQRPISAGSDAASAVQNLALGSLMERSPFFAAMFGRNAINRASDRFLENQRA